MQGEAFFDVAKNASGEAFFDVAKNAQYPLYVSTNYVNIKVLGTAFNVKTDEKHQNVETVLARGKVVFTR